MKHWVCRNVKNTCECRIKCRAFISSKAMVFNIFKPDKLRVVACQSVENGQLG